MAQVPMRMPQPGISTQQRPPHGAPMMMGMQPPPTNVPDVNLFSGVMVSMPTPVMATPIPQPAQVPSVPPSTGLDVAHAVDAVVAQPPQGVPQQQVPPQAQPVLQQHQQSQQHTTHNQQSLAQQPQLVMTNVANTKEKTPMCLINELARFNKIQHQYRLTDEAGPAHKKTFTVTLKLGEEEYTASGPSIKKAQHATAAIALEKTTFKHPPPKSQRNNRIKCVRQPLCPTCRGRNSYLYKKQDAVQPECHLLQFSPVQVLRVLSDPSGNITPTVELNALAMKRGEPAVYTFIEPPRPSPYMPPNLNFRGMYNQRYHYGKQPGYPPLFYVCLRVGARELIGEGHTAQAAKHNAAGKALRILKDLPVPDTNKFQGQENGSLHSTGTEDLDPNAELKSPISLVHEVALKRNLPVNFEVIHESGPPHMRTFVTRCSVGDILTEGEGNGKKVSKKRAAEEMLAELKKLPSLPPATITKIKRKPTSTKKKSRNLIKVPDQKASPEYGQGINPISRLIQIQQAKKEKEPVYTLIAERGMPRRREFVMQVTVGLQSCTGTGPNKKLAKRAAAEGLLQLLGYSRAQPQPGKPAMKNPGEGGEVDKNRKNVTFLEESQDKVGEVVTGGGRQLVPGLLLMPDGNTVQNYGQQLPNQGPAMGQSLNVAQNNMMNMQTTATIAKELLKGGSSPTAEALVKSGQIQKMTTQSAVAPSQMPGQVRPKDQLQYLAQLLNFQVQFTDFPKGNKSEYLSLVSLSTVPPQVSHGAGTTIDASHDQAAITALRALAELGLDTLAPANPNLKKEGVTMAGGDGLHLANGQKPANSAPNMGAGNPVGK